MQNKVELIGYYGGDESHSLSAWTSTSRDLTDEKRERMPQLLHFLAKEGHHTPFEKSSLHFLVTCDTASHIHLNGPDATAAQCAIKPSIVPLHEPWGRPQSPQARGKNWKK